MQLNTINNYIFHLFHFSAVNRQCFEECNVGGFKIPVGTLIQVNGFAVHMDPDLWGPQDPKLFIPERLVINTGY